MSLMDLSGYAPCQMSGERMRYVSLTSSGQPDWTSVTATRRGSAAAQRVVRSLERCPMCQQMVKPTNEQWPSWPQHLAKVAAQRPRDEDDDSGERAFAQFGRHDNEFMPRTAKP